MAPPQVVRRARTQRPEPRRRRIPSWIPVVLISALILGGLAMIAIGLARDGDEGPAPQPSGQEATPPAPSGGTEQPAPAEDQEPEPAPAEPAEPSESPGAADVALERRTFENRFAIGVPTGWENGVEDGGISLTAPGATAQIVVFFEQGGRPARQLARAARGFLGQRHQDAQIGAPTTVRLGPHRALRIEATYQGGEEVAVVLSARGFSHVVLRRVDRGASPDLERQADAALSSFRPR